MASHAEHDTSCSTLQYGICRETGLPERPPTTYPDGRPRYRLCRKCRECKPLEQFGKIIHREDSPYSEAGIYRRRICGKCHSQRVVRRRRERRGRQVKKQVGEALEAIKKTTSAANILAIVERVAMGIGRGDIEQFAQVWVELFHNPKTSNRLKVSSLQALVCMMASASLADAADAAEANPVQLALEWHEKQQLVPLVRAFLDDGLITLDDIDPPPEEY